MYAHLYPSKQYELAEKLSEDRTRASEKINLTGDDENVAYCEAKRPSLRSKTAAFRF